jgi:hypothetical protein
MVFPSPPTGAQSAPTVSVSAPAIKYLAPGDGHLRSTADALGVHVTKCDAGLRRHDGGEGDMMCEERVIRGSLKLATPRQTSQRDGGAPV